MSKNEILIAADHAGFELKEYLKDYLIDKSYSISDLFVNYVLVYFEYLKTEFLVKDKFNIKQDRFLLINRITICFY